MKASPWGGGFLTRFSLHFLGSMSEVHVIRNRGFPLCRTLRNQTGTGNQNCLPSCWNITDEHSLAIPGTGGKSPHLFAPLTQWRIHLYVTLLILSFWLLVSHIQGNVELPLTSGYPDLPYTLNLSWLKICHIKVEDIWIPQTVKENDRFKYCLASPSVTSPGD